MIIVKNFVLFGLASARVGLNRLVQQRCHIFLAVAMRGAEHHDAVLDGERVQMVQHDMIRLWQQCGLALEYKMGIV